ncbi:hypothetical protein [Bradyrhizobium sp. USDA 10063]
MKTDVSAYGVTDLLLKKHLQFREAGLAAHRSSWPRKTVGGNNQEAIADGYVREDIMIYGDHGLQFVNGTLTGKYRYFTPPKRLSIRDE